MKIPTLFICLVIIFASCNAQNPVEKTFNIYSENVKDSFEIYVDLPTAYKSGDTCDVFYYLDANLKSGKKLRKIIRDSLSLNTVKKTIYVGIGHIGNYRVLRRRDFTVPRIEDKDTTGRSGHFGQIENFYSFLIKELIPAINNSYTTTNNNSILGHSFGGLFTVYCLFKNDSIFENYYSLSPSLWINNYSVYKFNHLQDSSKRKKYLFLSVGGWEILNRIKPGADKFNDYLLQKNYAYLSFEYNVYKGKTHNSQVPDSFEDIFKLRIYRNHSE